MKLEDFAKQAGCVVSLAPEDERWEGKWQYKSKELDNVTVVGYRTERAAYKAFMQETFGIYGTRAVSNLLKKVERLEQANKELRSKL